MNAIIEPAKDVWMNMATVEKCVTSIFKTFMGKSEKSLFMYTMSNQ